MPKLEEPLALENALTVETGRVVKERAAEKSRKVRDTEACAPLLCPDVRAQTIAAADRLPLRSPPARDLRIELRAGGRCACQRSS